MTVAEQTFAKMRSEEAGAAGDETGFSFRHFFPAAATVGDGI